MKNILILLLVLIGLTACDTLQSPVIIKNKNTPSVINTNTANQLADIDAITQKAKDVAAQVKSGEINRTQAADVLNDFRLRRVGNNVIDDDTFLLYRRITVQRGNGTLTQSDAQAIIETKLRDWRRRWDSMNNKPKNPAFTNFLLRIYNLPMLGK